MTPGLQVEWSLRAVAARLAVREGQDALCRRTVILPNPRMRVALLRLLVVGDDAGVANGLQLVLGVQAAESVLRHEGIEFSAGEEKLLAPRLRRLIADGGLDPEHFGRELLTTTRGWDEAFATTILDLENEGLEPEDLAGVTRPEVRGLVEVWRSARQAAGLSWSRGRILGTAARELASRSDEDPPAALSPRVVAVVGSDVGAAEARFVSAIPGVELVVLAARPMRQRYLDRLERLFGAQVAAAVRDSSLPIRTGCDSDVVASFLLEPVERQQSSARSRAEADGSVRLEDFASVESELVAAARWVEEQILDGTELGDIAVLVPQAGVLVSMLADRITPVPVHVAGGVAVTSHIGGARLLTVVRALRRHLGPEDLAAVLPCFKTDGGEDPRPVAKGAALDLAFSLGCVGGSAANPRGALDWSDHVDHHLARLSSALAAETAGDDLDDDEAARRVRSRHEHERQLEQLSRVRSGVRDLVAVARLVVDGASITDLWSGLLDFATGRLRLPADGHRVLELIDRELAPVRADTECSAASGDEALRLIEQHISGLRMQTSRFGDPAVYVGTLRSAAGLAFERVRVIGMSEGAVPRNPREDPVLSDELRAELGLPETADWALWSIHDFDAVVRGASRLALSMPRLGLERSYREPSSLFLEVVAALGRHDGGSLTDVLASELAASRRRARECEHASTGTTGSFDLVAREKRRDRLPAAWTSDAAADLQRIADQLLSPKRAAWPHGLLGREAPVPLLPGLTSERPVSASRLRVLLECPYRFLLEHVLGYEEPAAPLPQSELSPLAFGSLFHRVAERFLTRHGDAFCARRGRLGDYQRLAADIARAEFTETLVEYPLAGEGVREQQLERLLRDLEGFLDYEWRQPASRFVASEKPFGVPEPVQVTVAGGSLWMRGYIDAIDIADGRVRVRDFKTGQCKPRSAKGYCDPHPTVDLQLAVYAVIAEQLADAWGTPGPGSAVYVHTNDRHGRERAFTGDFDDLLTAGKRWLSIGARLLDQRLFPRTPLAEDCRFCPFSPVCGSDAPAGAQLVLEAVDGVLAEFRELKLGEEEA